MRYSQVSPNTEPAIDLLMLTEAKAHLRVDVDDDDAFITWAIKAATKTAERFTRRFFITQEWDFTLNDFPSLRTEGTDVISIMRGASQSVTSVKYWDEDGAEQTLAAGTDYRAYPTTGDGELRIGLVQGATWPAVELVRLDAVTIRAVMGYGDTSASVPDDILWAVKLILGDIYEHREQSIVGQVASLIPNSAHNILLPLQMPIYGGQQ